MQLQAVFVDLEETFLFTLKIFTNILLDSFAFHREAMGFQKKNLAMALTITVFFCNFLMSIAQRVHISYYGVYITYMPCAIYGMHAVFNEHMQYTVYGKKTY